ncbi:MAG: DUF3108 domain-containing protein [Thermodesulfobacteriota bacterium]
MSTVFVISVLFLLGAGAFGDGLDESAQSAPGAGKVFHYTASRFGIPIFKAAIKIENSSPVQGKLLLQVHATFQSLPYLGALFRMNNRFTSTMETDTCFPVRYEKEVDQEGLLIKKKNYLHMLLFDPSHQKVTIEKKETGEKKEVDIPPSTYDPLSMFARYYLKEELRPGQDIRMSIYDGVKVRAMVFHSRQEKVKSKKYGTVEAVRLESTTSFSTFGDKEGIIRIWYTADGQRVPLLMELDLPVGNVKFELEEVKEG